MHNSLAPLRVLIVSTSIELSSLCAAIIRSEIDSVVYECHHIDILSDQLELTTSYQFILFIKPHEMLQLYKKKYSHYITNFEYELDSKSDYQKELFEYLQKIKNKFLHQDYKPIHHNLVLFYDYLPVDLYTQNSSKQFVDFLKARTIIKKRDINHLIEMGSIYFYVKSQDVPTLEKYANKVIETNLLEVSLQNDEALNYLKRFRQLTIDQFPSLNPKVMNEYDYHFLRATKLLLKVPKLKSALRTFLSLDGYHPIHMYMVGLISFRLMSLSGLWTEAGQTLIAFASVIHDLALDIRDGEEYDLTNKLEQGVFDQSFTKSSNLLHHGEEVISWVLDIENIPDWIPDILLKHHERPQGNGFPIGEDIKNYEPQVATFIIAHMVFDDVYMRRNSSTQRKETLKRFKINDFKNGTSRSIALRVEELDIFTN